MESTLDELKSFLQPTSRIDVIVEALNICLGLSGDCEGRSMLMKHEEILRSIVRVYSSSHYGAAHSACLVLINLSIGEMDSSKLIKITQPSLVPLCFQYLLSKSSKLADQSCTILCNLTRSLTNVEEAMSQIDDVEETLGLLLEALVQEGFNTEGAHLSYVSALLSNISQLGNVRKYLLQHLKKLLPFTDYKLSKVKRGGAVAAIRNCSFDSENHHAFIDHEDEVLTCLLKPLAGPEEFDDEDNEKLPIDLQYLDPTKTREEDPDIRKMLLETLLQLCATRDGRVYLRDRNAYIILREYHKWETDDVLIQACENIVDVLIKEEEEINIDNLRHIQIPDDVAAKFGELSLDNMSENKLS